MSSTDLRAPDMANDPFCNALKAQEKFGRLLDQLNAATSTIKAVRTTRNIIQSLNKLGFTPAKQAIFKKTLYHALTGRTGGNRIDPAEKTALIFLVGGTLAINNMNEPGDLPTARQAGYARLISAHERVKTEVNTLMQALCPQANNSADYGNPTDAKNRLLQALAGEVQAIKGALMTQQTSIYMR